MTMEQTREAGWSDAQMDCRRLFEENSHPMWVVEAREVVAVNRAALLHYGYSRDEFLAMSIDDLSVDRAPGANAAHEPCAVRRHRRKDGSFIDVEMTSFAVTFRGRAASLASVLDVTYRPAGRTFRLQRLLLLRGHLLGSHRSLLLPGLFVCLGLLLIRLLAHRLRRFVTHRPVTMRADSGERNPRAWSEPLRARVVVAAA